MAEPVNMLDEALWIASNNIPVFPCYQPVGDKCSCNDPDCKSQGKHPLCRGGFKAATTNRKKIIEWWSRHPHANIGIPTGSTTGFLVVDCDPRNGGPANRAELIDRIGDLPETAEQITGGGGIHVLLRYPGGPVPKLLGKGIDLKGDGGYILVAPSLHKSGERYRWNGPNGRDALLNLAEAPPALLAAISARRVQGESTKSGGRRGERMTGPVRVRGGERSHDSESGVWVECERNNKLFNLAFILQKQGFQAETVRVIVQAVNRLQCNPPLSEAEVAASVKSALRYGGPNTMPQWAEFVDRRHGLSDGAKRLYTYLAFRHRADPNPRISFETLAKRLGKSARRVRADMRVLVRDGYVISIRCGKKQPNRYQVVEPPQLTAGSRDRTHPSSHSGDTAASLGTGSTPSDRSHPSVPYMNRAIERAQPHSLDTSNGISN